MQRFIRRRPKPLIVVIHHGDRRRVRRPRADLVCWIGRGNPRRGKPWDLWYTANLKGLA